MSADDKKDVPLVTGMPMGMLESGQLFRDLRAAMMQDDLRRLRRWIHKAPSGPTGVPLLDAQLWLVAGFALGLIALMLIDAVV